MIWFATNHRPLITDTTNSIWDRVKLVPFNVRFHRPEELPEAERQQRLFTVEGEAKPLPVVDLDLKRKLRAELPGILAWAVAGYSLYRQDGLREPDVVKVATEDYGETQDVLGQWMEECCVVDDGKAVTKTQFKALFASYKCWCETYSQFTMQFIRFGSQLTEWGYISVTGAHGQKYRLGIGLAPTEE